METEATSPLRPATFEDEWDDPMMAQIKRWESEDRAEFGCSEEARVWLERIRQGQAGWNWTVNVVSLPVYDGPPVPLYSAAVSP